MNSRDHIQFEKMNEERKLLFPLPVTRWSSSGSSIRRCNAFWLNIRFRMFCSYHLRSCVTICLLSSLYFVLWSFEHVRYEQHESRFCTITQPRGGGTSCSGHTRNAHIKFELRHLQFRHGSGVGTNEPFANFVLLYEQPKTKRKNKEENQNKRNYSF